MIFGTVLTAILIFTTNLTITEPVNGETYDGDWLTVRAIVENENEAPDSVSLILNGGPFIEIPKLDTDWYTYMANDLHTGFSESPAPMDNTVLWTAPVTGDTHEFCSPVVVDGVVYFVSDQQSMAYALDAVTGEIIWQYDVVDHVDDAVTWYDGKVYIAADSAWCLDALTGQRVWSFKPSGLKMNGTPALGDGVAYFSFAPDYGSLQVYALDAETGAQIWMTNIPSYSTGCVTLSENRLFVPTFSGNLYSLDAGNGQILWQNSDSPTGYWDSSPVVVDNNIYICGDDGITRGIDADSGETIWETAITPGLHYIAATPAYFGERLYFADQVNSFHCLGTLSGNEIWTAPGVQHGSPGIADGIVFYGEGADRTLGEVRAISCDSGTDIWSYQTGGNQIFSSPAITDGIVYIAGMDWNLYAFGKELRFTYLDDLYAEIGYNQLIVTAFQNGIPVAADSISFNVTGVGVIFQPSPLLNITISPNPFHSSATVSFSLAQSGFTSVRIYDIAGRMVKTLLESGLAPGEYHTVWDGQNQSGELASAGFYFCRIESGDTIEINGMCLLR